MHWIRSWLALCVFASLAQAQFPIKIQDAKVGLPASRIVSRTDNDGKRAYVVKNNSWAPVYVSLEIVKEVKKDAAIVVETTDTEDLSSSIAVPLQNLTAELPGTRLSPAELRFIPYVRPAGGDVTVSIRVPNPGTPPARWSLLAEPFKLRYVQARDRSTYVVLALGSTMPGFTLPKEEESDPDNFEQGKALRGGRIEMAEIKTVGDMPDQWFGYDSADIAVLSTTNDKFLSSLFTDPANQTRVDALLEWIRRGGQLVVSVGRNANLVMQTPKLHELLPLAIVNDNPSEQMTRLPIVWGFEGTATSTQGPLAARNNAPFAVANLQPRGDRSARSLVPPASRREKGDRAIVAQSTFGMGRITVVAFDLDSSPFADAGFRGEFWDLLLREAGAGKASTGALVQKNTNISGLGDREDEIATNLRGYIDHFDGVPVISFGWVALFILLYTLLIGPVEYFFLKKVLKRLELTWITFPIIVMTVSAIAYFTAYAIKGNDLKMNKIDVIDIDPASNRIYGKFWLTVFSPRIDTYRIGMEPNPGWTEPVNESPTTGDLVDWFGGTRSGRESIFRRSYYYSIEQPGTVKKDPFVSGLIDVPIPVWSTKAFSADWSATLDKTTPPVVSNLIAAPGDASRVIGEFTLNLPVEELSEVYILYAGKAYKQANPIRPGQPVRPSLNEEDREWLREFGVHQGRASEVPTSSRNFGNFNDKPDEPNTVIMGELLFHEKSFVGDASEAPRNSSLRRLDQSWRLSSRNRDEIIVVAKLATVKGKAEEVLTAKNTISPTLLWLKELPGDGRVRAPIPGTLQQDTYIRIYVPIKR